MSSHLVIPRGWIGPGGLAGLQNRDGGASGVSGGFDSHTLPPPVRLRLLLLLLLLLLLSPVSRLLAQDTTRARDTLRKVPDTLIYHRAPVSPMGGFFRSLVLPGWGQAKLGRKLTGGLFIAWEGVTLGMAIKADRELAYLKERGDSAEVLDSKRQEREDWLILLAFNHLFAGLEAFVSAHLWDFPHDLRLRNAPQGYGAVVEVPVRLP